jgi:hypothetical protein
MPICLTNVRKDAIDHEKVLIGNKPLILKRMSTYLKKYIHQNCRLARNLR